MASAPSADAELPVHDVAFKQLALVLEDKLFAQHKVTSMAVLRQMYNEQLLAIDDSITPGNYRGDRLKCRIVINLGPEWSSAVRLSETS